MRVVLSHMNESFGLFFAVCYQLYASISVDTLRAE
jgi:hypothetical protein